MTTELQTAEDVIRELGGPGQTARLTQRKSQHVWNWKKANRLPAEFYLVVNERLKTKNQSAPPELFGITRAS